MPYFALFYDTVEDFVERRKPFRQQHLAQIDAAYADHRLVLAGALEPMPERSSGAARDATQKPAGALLVFHADDAAEVERFARNDPYVTSGLVTRWRVHGWAVVVGEHALPR